MVDLAQRDGVEEPLKETTTGAAGKPRVFVSSTVRDMGDLRSALKWWFEQNGYDAQLSEYNDFEKPLIQHSYQACIDAIQNADYFVLLIGSRVGGWLDRDAKVSITRAEYRKAYELFRTNGKPVPITFVRRAILDVREDRRGLERLLSAEYSDRPDLSEEDRAKLVAHPSKLLEDADAILSFVDEVSRAAEAERARLGGLPFPVANWIHAFDRFSELVSVFERELRVRPVRGASLAANVRADLDVIARELCMPDKKSKRGLIAAYNYVAPFRTRLSGDLTASVEVELSGEELASVGAFLTMFRNIGAWLPKRAVREAVDSGEFLEWVPEVHGYRPTAVHAMLRRLERELVLLERCAGDSPRLDELVKHWTRPGWRKSKTERVRTDLIDLLPAAHLHDRHQNVLDLAAALYSVLLSGDLEAHGRLSLWEGVSTRAKRKGFAEWPPAERDGGSFLLWRASAIAKGPTDKKKIEKARKADNPEKARTKRPKKS